MAVFLLILSCIGFLVSPAFCSIAVFFFGINGIRDIHPKQWFTMKWWLLCLLWVFFFALSWFWSIDKNLWGEHLRVKLPFLILPLAFYFIRNFTHKQFQIITISLALVFTGGCLYSLILFFNKYDYYVAQYNVARLLPTPVRNDYIRFSTALALLNVWCFYAWQFLEKSIYKWIVGICLFIIFIYLHFLASKSGLISIYLFLFIWSIYYAIAYKKWLGLLFVIAIPILITVALDKVPTLHKRYIYIRYSKEMYDKGDRSGLYGDLGRIMSYEIAYKVIHQHPFFGVGTGDMLKYMKLGYKQYYPDVKEEHMLLPHNQLLIIALGCGIPAMICFLVWYIFPLFQLPRKRESFYFLMVWIILLIQLLIEPTLEVQYGVFVFLFFLLLHWKTLNIPSTSFTKIIK